MKVLLILCLSVLCFGAPKSKLSETGLYQDILNKTVATANQKFSPQYPLWTDGAIKQRWIFLPAGTKINSENEDQWIFPVGTKIWKEFTFTKEDGTKKRVETRLIEKMPDEEWEYSTYLWNENESDALLAPEDGIKNYFPVNQTVKHDIPSVTECTRCHQHGGDAVVGFDALQLSIDRDPMAPHQEKLTPEMITLKKLIDENRLTHISANIQSADPRIHSATKEGRAILGYMHANCATCHNPQGSSKHISLSLHHVLSAKYENATPSFKTTMNRLTQVYAIPGIQETFRIQAGKPEKSAMIYMMKNFNASHMPPLGSKVVDTQAVELLSAWIMYFGD